MALYTSVTPDTIATALGRPSLDPQTPTALQWDMWISDALMLIETRVDSITRSRLSRRPGSTTSSARLW